MKSHYIFYVLIAFCWNSVYSQSKTEYFKEVYSSLDTACYRIKIQEDINKFDQWLKDSLSVYNSIGMKPLHRPSGIDLQRENKIYALAVTLTNTANYSFEDDIYDYLIIDSSRVLVSICVDDKMNVTGITDTEFPGSFIDLKDDFYFFSKKERKQIKEMIHNIDKDEPELILFCSEWHSSFWYIKDKKIYWYNLNTRKEEELNEAFQRCPDINLIKKSDEILYPYAIQFKNQSMFYRKTGNTPADELRICY